MEKLKENLDSWARVFFGACYPVKYRGWQGGAGRGLGGGLARAKGWAAGWRGRRVGRGEVRRLRYGEGGARIANKKEVGKFHPCAVLP